MKCLKKGGVCIIEHSEMHGEYAADMLDPFGAEIIHMPYLLLKWSKGLFGIRDILNTPKSHKASWIL